jgi:Gram-negative bacterial TonB protein C-terminal
MPEGSQRCSRTKMVLPLRVWVNGEGKTLRTQLAHTIDISHIGCRLGGLRMELSPGQSIAIQRGQNKASFRVIWSKRLAYNESQAGIEALDYGKDIWAVDLPPSPYAPKVSFSERGAIDKFIPLVAHPRVRWGLSLGLLVLGLALVMSRYGQPRYQYQSEGLAIQPDAPAPPSAEDLARLAPTVHTTPVLLTKLLGSSASRVQVAEAPLGHIIYPTAPDDSIRGKVRLQIIIAANGAVKQIHALSGKQPLAEAAAQAVRLWRYSSFPGVERFTERETSVTVSFAGADAVSLEFPSPNTQVHVD